MRSLLRVALFLLGVVAVAVPALASGEGTLVTDPELLMRMGFAADARNVYMVAPGKRAPVHAPKDFGTSDQGYTNVPGNKHIPRASSTYATMAGFGDIYLVSGDLFYDALLDMPNGAELAHLQWVGIDASAAEISHFLIRSCQFTGETPTLTVLFFHETDIDSGNYLVSLPPDESVNVDNSRCTYVARTRFGSATPNLRLVRFRGFWRRQVSLAPAVATFPNDTPTTHPYFRFIEALAAAGITGGCGPGSYCPSAPITRGEMAVFLSVALGLHWP
jgi:hypothetical protein